MKTHPSFFAVIVGSVLVIAAPPFPLNAQTPIPLENPSFELPGTEKIKGWDGECTDASWTGLLEDIPGWSSDLPAFDSGVETGQSPTDGLWSGFIMAQDTSVYQITDYEIQAGDDIALTADAKNTWSATLLKMGLFYVDALWTVFPIVSEQYEITDSFTDYTVRFKSTDFPAAVGFKLGVEFDNVSPTARSWIGLDNVQLENYGSTHVPERQSGLNGFSLAGNYPNPFNPSTRIFFTLKSNSPVRLAVHDLMGREVAVLMDGVQNSGGHDILFSGTGLPGGIYFCKLQTQNEVAVRKMILAK